MKANTLDVYWTTSRRSESVVQTLALWQERARLLPVVLTVFLLIGVVLLMPAIVRGQEAEVYYLQSIQQ